MLEPVNDTDLAFVLEFKTREEGEQTLQDTVAAARKQIQDKPVYQRTGNKRNKAGENTVLWVCVSGEESIDWIEIS